MVKIQKQNNKKEQEVKNLLNPKNDYVFKRIFGHTGNEEITKGLLSAIIEEQINDVILDCNPITEKDLLDDKVGILDIKAKLNNNTNCNIEMQIVDYKDIEKRLLFYWSKMYTSSITSGDDYKDLEKGIVILISDYNLENLKEINKYITKWNLREEENSKIILTDVLEVYIIELKKVKENIQNNNSLNSWLNFINNPGVILKMENKEIKQAREVLEEISRDKKERYLAELRQKYIMDQRAIEDAGFDKGVKAGIQQNKIEVAKKMKLKDMPSQEISEITGLTEEEINNL